MHLTTLRLDEDQIAIVRNGRGLDARRVEGASTLHDGGAAALLDATGARLVAIAERRGDELAVLRGFRDATV